MVDTLDAVEVAPLEIPDSGVEPGYEIAPAAVDVIGIAPIDDVVDGEWCVIDEPGPVLYMETETALSGIDTYQAPSPSMGAGDQPYRQPAPSYAPVQTVQGRPAPMRLSYTWITSWVDSLLDMFTLDWLFPDGPQRHTYGPVDYVFFAVPSRLGASAHYYLVNVCKLRMASETFDDSAEFVFSVPVYHKNRCENALNEIVGDQWRQVGG